MKNISVESPNGIESAVLVTSFDVKSINKTFAVISKNEVLSPGMSKVYICEIATNENGVNELTEIANESEWDQVIQTMKEIVRGGKVSSSKVVNDNVKMKGYKLIGIKDEQKNILANNVPESSFTVEESTPKVEESTIEDTPNVTETPKDEVSVSSEIKDVPASEPVQEETNIFDQIKAASVVEPVPDAVVTPEVSKVTPVVIPSVPVNEPVEKENTETVSEGSPVQTEESNIFDNAPAKETPVTPETSKEEVTPVVENSEPAFDMPTIENTVEPTIAEVENKVETEISKDDVVDACFARIKAELMKKDQIIKEQETKIANLESELKNLQNVNVYETPGQTLTYKQAA